MSVPSDGSSGDELLDVDVFQAVFDELWEPVVRYCARRLGADAGEQVAADVFAEAFIGRSTFDASRGSVRGWVFGIASHLVAREWRVEQRRWLLLGRASCIGVVVEPALELLDERLLQALGKLSAVDRDAVLLVAWAELSYEEVAQVQGVPIGTVRSRLHRARRVLSAALAGEAEVG